MNNEPTESIYDRVVAEFSRRGERVTAATATLIADRLEDEGRENDVVGAVERFISRRNASKPE